MIQILTARLQPTLAVEATRKRKALMIQILTARLQPTLALPASSLAKEATSVPLLEIRVRTSVNL